jgi:ferredoxin
MPMLNIVEGCQLTTPDGHCETVTMRIFTRVCRRCGRTLEMCPGGIIPNIPICLKKATA